MWLRQPSYKSLDDSIAAHPTGRSGDVTLTADGMTLLWGRVTAVREVYRLLGLQRTLVGSDIELRIEDAFSCSLLIFDGVERRNLARPVKISASTGEEFHSLAHLPVDNLPYVF
jgi:hypothetical protein